MSAPAPVSVKTPLLIDVLPARPTVPTSWLDQRLSTTTLSNVAVAAAEVVWLDTARPIKTVCPNAIVSVPTTVQVVPSADCDAVIALPARVSRTQ